MTRSSLSRPRRRSPNGCPTSPGTSSRRTPTGRAHIPTGIVDLSVGTPVDPTPAVVRRALEAASDSPGYPTTIGRPATRQAAVDWLARRHGVTGLGLDGVLPVIGTKELVAALPTQLGFGPADLVVLPELAYPTYAVGAALAGTRVVAADSLTQLGPERPALLWVNSPANPTGRVLGRRPPAQGRRLVPAARHARSSATSATSSCAWDAEPVSVLHPDVCGGVHDGILAVHSLSKRSNLAGYRCGFVAGDPALVAELLAVRKNLGPDPARARSRSPWRRRWPTTRTPPSSTGAMPPGGRRCGQRSRRAGFRIDHSEASLYLWATRDQDCWETVADLAGLGILVAPGSFYGPTGRRHVRVALTATDERVAAAAARLASVA